MELGYNKEWGSEFQPFGFMVGSHTASLHPEAIEVSQRDPLHPYSSSAGMAEGHLT